MMHGTTNIKIIIQSHLTLHDYWRNWNRW